MPLGSGVGSGGSGLCGSLGGPSAFSFLDRMTWQMMVTLPDVEPDSCFVYINEDVNFESLQAFARVAPSGGSCTIQVYKTAIDSCTEAAYGGVLTIASGQCESNVLTNLADPLEGEKYAFSVTADSGAELITVALNCNKTRSN